MFKIYKLRPVKQSYHINPYPAGTESDKPLP